jgi:hypothetical protein
VRAARAGEADPPEISVLADREASHGASAQAPQLAPRPDAYQPHADAPAAPGPPRTEAPPATQPPRVDTSIETELPRREATGEQAPGAPLQAKPPQRNAARETPRLKPAAEAELPSPATPGERARRHTAGPTEIEQPRVGPPARTEQLNPAEPGWRRAGSDRQANAPSRRRQRNGRADQDRQPTPSAAPDIHVTVEIEALELVDPPASRRAAAAAAAARGPRVSLDDYLRARAGA